MEACDNYPIPLNRSIRSLTLTSDTPRTFRETHEFQELRGGGCQTMSRLPQRSRAGTDHGELLAVSRGTIEKTMREIGTLTLARDMCPSHRESSSIRQ